MSDLIKNRDYRNWIGSIKDRIQASQIKAALSVNRELLDLYWFIGEQIIEKQKAAEWGDGFLPQMSLDLLAEFPEIKGFSLRNLKYMRQWVRLWAGSPAIGPQAVAQLESGGKSNAKRAIVPQVVAQLEAKGKQVVSQLGLDAKQLVSQIPRGHIYKNKSDIKVEFSIRDLRKPIGVSEYQIIAHLPDNVKSLLLTIKQIEAEFGEVE